MRRSEVLLEESLSRIGGGLEQSKQAHPVGADAILNRGRHFPFHPDGVGHNEHQHRKNTDDLNCAKNDELGERSQSLKGRHRRPPFWANPILFTPKIITARLLLRRPSWPKLNL